MSSNLREALNEGNLNRIDAMSQRVALGDCLQCVPRIVMNGTVAANRMVLPDEAKAIAVLKAHNITGSTGMTIEPLMGTTPAAGEIAVAPNGDLEFAAADGVAAADVCYVTPDADVVEWAVVPVVASVATLPQSRRAWILIEVEILTGIDLQVINGASINARAAAPADNTANLGNAGTTVVFNAGDVVAGTCRIKALCARASNLTTKLALASGY